VAWPLGLVVVDPIAAIPPVNTLIVAVVGALILWGVHRIRRGQVQSHKRSMIAATALFGLFLTLYIVRMVVHGPTSFAAQNPAAPAWAATFYYVFLGTHMVLAVVTIALIPLVFLRAMRSHWTEHRRLARKVAPMWLVSIVMGIAVYFLLFQVW
jgi:putative membrane protein